MDHFAMRRVLCRLISLYIIDIESCSSELKQGQVVTQVIAIEF
jgi:hypothetical protein